MVAGKKYTFEEVKEYANNLGYEIISEKYINCFKKLIFKDDNGYYYLNTFRNLNRYYKLPIFHISNPYTIQNIKLWCKLNNKPFELLSDIYKGNDKNLKWRCLKENCNDMFEMNWNHIQSGRNCAVCDGRQVGLSNCLATKRPDIASQWHPTLNNDLTPYDVTVSAGKSVWWQCSKNLKHKWYALISSRTSSNCDCPYCAGLLPSEDYNLLICNPELCEEWDYNKNDKKPEEYCPNSGEYVWWKCSNLECNHEWKTSIGQRNGSGTGCPQCSKSKGEKKIDKILTNKNWIKINQEEFDKLIDVNKYNMNYFTPQMKFKGLLGLKNGSLSYDFYIPKLNLLIEYQGEFHDGTAYQQTEEEFKIQQEHDRRKKEYTKINNIKLLEIWYWDFDRIEEILERELNILLLKEVI